MNELDSLFNHLNVKRKRIREVFEDTAPEDLTVRNSQLEISKQLNSSLCEYTNQSINIENFTSQQEVYEYILSRKFWSTSNVIKLMSTFSKILQSEYIIRKHECSYIE